MNKTFCKPIFLAALLAAAGHAAPAAAYYSAGVTLDAGGGNAAATDLAAVNCYDNGAGAPHHLAAAVQDMSPPVSGLLVGLHIFKDIQMTTATDAASADGGWSPIASLAGGAGTYYLSVRKTKAGARNVYVGWECQTAANAATGTGISVLQVQ